MPFFIYSYILLDEGIPLSHGAINSSCKGMVRDYHQAALACLRGFITLLNSHCQNKYKYEQTVSFSLIMAGISSV